MTEKEFLSAIRRRIAQTSIGSSAIRNQGTGGLIEILHTYLERNLSLDKFFAVLRNENQYQQFLDHHTNKILERFPKKAKNCWGAARKGLNLFLRDIVYNKFLAERYNLPTSYLDFNQVVKNMEVPLDKMVAVRIRRDTNKAAIPWKSIKSLLPEESDLYQIFAQLIAESRGVAKVQLDLIYWREQENKVVIASYP